MKYFVPKISEAIEQIFQNSDLNSILTNEKENVELSWYLLLFTKLVRAPGEILLTYKTVILSVFHRCFPIVNKNAYGIVAQAAKGLLEALTQLYPMDYRLTMENIDFLPIRVRFFGLFGGI